MMYYTTEEYERRHITNENLRNPDALKYIKSEEEVKAFIEEQDRLLKAYMEMDIDDIPIGDDTIQGYSRTNMREFLGEELIKAVHLPQYDYCDLEGSILCGGDYISIAQVYYHDLYLHLLDVLIEVEDDNLANRPLTRTRRTYLNQSDAARIRLLNYLNEKDMTEEEYFHAFGRRVYRRYYEYFFPLIPFRQSPKAWEKDRYEGAVSGQYRVQYRNMIKMEVMEHLNQELIYNTYVGAGI